MNFLNLLFDNLFTTDICIPKFMLILLCYFPTLWLNLILFKSNCCFKHPWVSFLWFYSFLLFNLKFLFLLNFKNWFLLFNYWVHFHLINWVFYQVYINCWNCSSF